MYKVSVVVPFFNAERYIERCLNSLLNQTLDNVQYILIDDGSTDESLEIINSLLNENSYNTNHVIVISRSNKGVAESRSEGIALATGEYITFLDSDDWAEVNWLQSMYEYAVLNDFDMVVCDYIVEMRGQSKAVYSGNLDGVHSNLALLLKGQIQGFLWNKLIKLNLCKGYSGFRADVNYLEDFIFILNCFHKTNRVSNLRESLIHYNRENEDSITQSMSLKKFDEVKKAINIIEAFLTEKKILESLNTEFNTFKLKQKSWAIHCDRKFINREMASLYRNANADICNIEGSWYLKYIASEMEKGNFKRLVIFLYVKQFLAKFKKILPF